MVILFSGAILIVFVALIALAAAGLLPSFTYKGYDYSTLKPMRCRLGMHEPRVMLTRQPRRLLHYDTLISCDCRNCGCIFSREEFRLEFELSSTAGARWMEIHDGIKYPAQT